MHTQKSVGLWIRVSTDFQVRDESPEHHEKRGRLYAEAKGWDVKEVYRLDALSGKSILDYSEAKRMLNDIKKGHITGLIFSKLARLARNTKELLEIAEIFKECDADLVSLQEAIDTSTPAGRLFYTMFGAMAQWEREEIADRVAASVPIRAKLGKPLGGQATFGYRWDGKELVIAENEAPIRKLVYELFKEHKRKGTVARLLNEMGYRTRNKSKFTDTTVGRLLRDTSAIGIRRANYTKSLGEGKKWVMKPESEWVTSTCPAIVDEDLWNECNAILDQQESTGKKPAKRVAHLFSGIVLCECGGKMYVPSDSTKYTCYKCRKQRIATDDLEDIYYRNLKTFLLTDQQLETFVAKADQTIQSKEVELKLLENESKRIENEMQDLLKLHTRKEIPTDGFGKFYAPLDTQLKQIEEAKPKLQAQIDFIKMEALNSGQLLHEAKTLYDRWPTLELESKRYIVEEITQNVTIGSEEISIKFSYTPSLAHISPDYQRNSKGSLPQST
ncbi:MAG TPA: recombinase family protein [Bacteroidia bacterium]|nr:recombinase family protein [Bacteroidia bacterium]